MCLSAADQRRKKDSSLTVSGMAREVARLASMLPHST